ncbi:MAG: flagellar hook-basal body complex protein FliE [Candidatus Eremiobacteraeota bacterium]|nr:flagellar hook-basal body complex protein FliE [Candidatus Eremiobacteraeota bacterium]
MNVTPLVVDRGPSGGDVTPAGPAALAQTNAFTRAVDTAGSALSAADRAEDAFAAHTGSLQDAVFERAQADVLLSVVTAAAQRSVQSVQTLLNMQI